MDIAIDLGNSYAKLGVFKEEKLVEYFSALANEDLLKTINKYLPAVDQVIISSVRSDSSFINDFLNKKNKKFLQLTSNTPVPLKVDYKSQATLGMDRLSAAVGGESFFPGQNCLVIDVGTCITYDFIDNLGMYRGGAISPGIALKLKALNTFTQKLPLIEFKEEFTVIGQSTEDCIRSGTIYGTIAEVEGFINYYRQQFSNLKVIICGGAANFFDSKIKAPIFVIPELVLIGLFRILQYNVTKNK